MKASRLFVGMAGSAVLLGASFAAAAQQAATAPPKLTSDEASFTQNASTLNVSLKHNACLADGHELTIGLSGGASLNKPLTQEQLEGLTNAYEKIVEPVLKSDMDPMISQLTVQRLLSGGNGTIIESTGPGGSLTQNPDVNLQHKQRIVLAFQMFAMQASVILQGNQPDGYGAGLSGNYSISKAPVAACMMQSQAPKAP